MNEPVTPTSPSHAETAGSCCDSAPAQPAAEVAPAQSSPCCGTSAGAEAAGACCDPQAKREAVTAVAGCC
ncbi:hypothetical protein OG723_39390 [Streptomyces sp. NBC_01278]|uniref:hypothetical protein n=1 Tax=unclassified Streptomyces TaxID=2593676 RepID=UPI002E15ECFD|nr:MULTISPECIES: hypothetical protein [unclassified Streptomyces]WSR23385.1 hypothetical protein OG573_32520 [Streptomyces sp. NBC_01205]